MAIEKFLTVSQDSRMTNLAEEPLRFHDLCLPGFRFAEKKIEFTNRNPVTHASEKKTTISLKNLGDFSDTSISVYFSVF